MTVFSEKSSNFKIYLPILPNILPKVVHNTTCINLSLIIHLSKFSETSLTQFLSLITFILEYILNIFKIKILQYTFSYFYVLFNFIIFFYFFYSIDTPWWILFIKFITNSRIIHFHLIPLYIFPLQFYLKSIMEQIIFFYLFSYNAIHKAFVRKLIII